MEISKSDLNRRKIPEPGFPSTSRLKTIRRALGSEDGCLIMRMNISSAVNYLFRNHGVRK